MILLVLDRAVGQRFELGAQRRLDEDPILWKITSQTLGIPHSAVLGDRLWRLAQAGLQWNSSLCLAPPVLRDSEPWPESFAREVASECLEDHVIMLGSRVRETFGWEDAEIGDSWELEYSTWYAAPHPIDDPWSLRDTWKYQRRVREWNLPSIAKPTRVDRGNCGG